MRWRNWARWPGWCCNGKASRPKGGTAELEEELSDVFVFLFKLAYQTGVDVEAALAGQAKAEGRYDDLAKASEMLARYNRDRRSHWRR